MQKIKLYFKVRKLSQKLIFVFILVMFMLQTCLSYQNNKNNIGINERLGKYVPLNLTFKDENNKAIKLKQLINKPTILSLVYFRCTGICTPLLNGLTNVLNELPSKLTQDYFLLTISFDKNDTADTAYFKKKNYLQKLNKPFNEDNWKFLTGDIKNINKLTGSVGFGFKKDGSNFIHQAGLIILNKNGKIIRYLYGISFLPFELKMALIEAQTGKVGPSINKVLKLCYSYDQNKKKYVFNFLKIVGILTFLPALLFFIYLLITSKSKKFIQEIPNDK